MTPVSETMRVSGVRCERCVMRLGGALRRLDGIEAANANLMGEVSLTWDADRLDRDTIVEALARAGFAVGGIAARPQGGPISAEEGPKAPVTQ
jgi:copper chaperone CopZ